MVKKGSLVFVGLGDNYFYPTALQMVLETDLLSNRGVHDTVRPLNKTKSNQTRNYG